MIQLPAARPATRVPHWESAGTCMVPRYSSTQRMSMMNRDRPWHGFCSTTYEEGVGSMLYYALIFLVVGLIAGALGIYGVAGVASQIAWVLFLVGIVFLVIHLISGRRPIV